MAILLLFGNPNGLIAESRFEKQEVIDALVLGEMFRPPFFYMNVSPERMIGALEHMRLEASQSQLEQLLTHSHPMLRAQVWRIYLSRFPDAAVDRAVPAMLGDAEEIDFNGLISWGRWTVGSAIFYLINQYMQDSDGLFRISENQKIKITEALLIGGLTTNSEGQYLSMEAFHPTRQMLREWVIDSCYRGLVVQLIENGNHDGYVALARMGFEKDVERFLGELTPEKFSVGLLSGISQWPHPLYYNGLVRIFKKLNDERFMNIIEMPALLDALIAYQDAATSSLLEKAVFGSPDEKIERQGLSGNIFSALVSKETNLRFYRPLLLRLVREDFESSAEMWNFFYSEDPGLAVSLTIHFIKNNRVPVTPECLNCFVFEGSQVVKAQGYGAPFFFSHFVAAEGKRSIPWLNLELSRNEPGTFKDVYGQVVPFKHPTTIDVLANILNNENVYDPERVKHGLFFIDSNRAQAVWDAYQAKQPKR